MTADAAPATRRPVILDVDTGFDDALALLLALRAPQLEVVAVTCVAGNHRLSQVVANTLKVLDAAGAGEIPVAAGMARALLARARTPMTLHGADGMADLGLPASSRKPAPVHAVELMRQTLEASAQPVTLIALAPLTNVAVLLRMYPHVAARLDSIMIMGGTFGDPGNTSPVAEFNIRCDPEAAAIVLGANGTDPDGARADLPIMLYTLDVFMQVGFWRDEIECFCAAHDPAARMAGEILAFSRRHFASDLALIGDAGAVAAVIDPALGEMRSYPIHVELGGAWSRGQTIVDRRPRGDYARLEEWARVSEREVHVIETIDAARCRALFAATLGVELDISAAPRVA